VATPASFALTNTAAALRGITLTAPTVKVGQAAQFTAMERYADGSTQNLTNQVQWVSDNPHVAKVDAMGKVTGESPGAVTLMATLDGVTQTFTVTVGAPTPVGITVSPAPAARPAGTASALGQPAPAPAPRSAPVGGAAPHSVGLTGGPPPAPIPTGR